MHGTTSTQFSCTNCNTLYHLIKVEAGPETVDGEINCRACGAPLPARDRQFVLKYFLLRKPSDASADAPSKLPELLQRPILSNATQELTVLDTLLD
jgi:hypothetical protein